MASGTRKSAEPASSKAKMAAEAKELPSDGDNPAARDLKFRHEHQAHTRERANDTIEEQRAVKKAKAAADKAKAAAQKAAAAKKVAAAKKRAAAAKKKAR